MLHFYTLLYRLHFLPNQGPLTWLRGEENFEIVFPEVLGVVFMSFCLYKNKVFYLQLVFSCTVSIDCEPIFFGKFLFFQICKALDGNTPTITSIECFYNHHLRKRYQRKIKKPTHRENWACHNRKSLKNIDTCHEKSILA